MSQERKASVDELLGKVDATCRSKLCRGGGEGIAGAKFWVEVKILSSCAELEKHIVWQSHRKGFRCSKCFEHLCFRPCLVDDCVGLPRR